MSNSEPYSTLEVRNEYQLPEVIDPEQSQKETVPNHSYQQHPTAGGIGPYPPTDGYYAHNVPPGSSYSPAASYGEYGAHAAKLGYVQAGQLGPTESSVETGEEKKPKRTICGVAPLTFYIILGVALIIIIGAIAGGVGGAMASKDGENQEAASAEPGNGDSTDSTNSTTTEMDDRIDILPSSRLTSSNWTDPDGFIHRIVFFQDAHNALVAREWDSENRTWATTNITGLFAPTTAPLNPVSGTPLASAAITHEGRFEIHLWFLDPTSLIRSVAHLDTLNPSDRWQVDSLDEAVLETRPGSLLAAAWQRPWVDGKAGSFAVAYQRPSDGAIKVANSSHWETSDVAVESNFVVDNSSLAIIPQRRETFLDRMQLVTQGLANSETTGPMQLTNYDAGWAVDEQQVLVRGIPLPSKKQQFAITMWDDWSNYLYVGLLDGGELTASHYDGSSFNSIDTINFSGGPERNFTAISMTLDGMLYAISSDEILEYSVDTSSPSNLRFVGTVFPA
ncbi:hypothetical protein DL764_002447 [Monosporascus ibericus]|uniref:Fucose-specific lectin n=1 Tax=Monosporascus ibericus TaxID=155417 RepID=A0A4Q4TLJ4_9PEZI|nr:hypothetical protein DL764_002447 [Monosporascus ibericus]